TATLTVCVILLSRPYRSCCPLPCRRARRHVHSLALPDALPTCPGGVDAGEQFVAIHVLQSLPSADRRRRRRRLSADRKDCNTWMATNCSPASTPPGQVGRASGRAREWT